MLPCIDGFFLLLYDSIHIGTYGYYHRDCYISVFATRYGPVRHNPSCLYVYPLGILYLVLDDTGDYVPSRRYAYK